MEGPRPSPGFSSMRKVPMLMSVAEYDESCSVDRARRIAHEIGDSVKTFRVKKDIGHMYYWDQTRTEELLEEVRYQLEFDVSEHDVWSSSFLEHFSNLINEFFEMDSAAFSHIATLSAAAIASLATTF